MKLFILQTVIPDYRKKFFKKIKKGLRSDFEFAGGDNYFEKSVKTDWSIKGIFPIKNHYFFNRKILFQSGMFRKAIVAKVLVLEMNPRILTNWIILMIRKLVNKKTVLWGHAWPRDGENSRSDFVRGWMRKLGNIIVTYTEKQSGELKKKMPEKEIVFAPNALYYKEEMKVLNKFEPLDVIYVGRLTQAKKPLILLKAFSKLSESLPEGARLILVGEGPEKERLLSFIKKNNMGDRIKILGHISDFKVIGNLYSQALLSVSPGYVGLSITQSFAFGVPMLISKDENHSPEIEAVIEGENSLFFDTDNVDDFSNKISDFYKQKKIWVQRRKGISEYCRERYCIERMAQPFLDLVT